VQLRVVPGEVLCNSCEVMVVDIQLLPGQPTVSMATARLESAFPIGPFFTQDRLGI